MYNTQWNKKRPGECLNPYVIPAEEIYTLGIPATIFDNFEVSPCILIKH